MVVAETALIAQDAAELIEVEYEDLPILSDPRKALLPGAPVVHDAHPDNVTTKWDYAQGDVAVGEAESDIVIEDTFRLHYVTHCCMGVSGIIADFDSSENLTLYSNTQVPFLHKREFAQVLQMDPARIRIIQPPIGGAFGSKLDIYPFEPICIFLAKATKRSAFPVIATWTWAPASRSRRTSSTALYAAMPPQTHSRIRRSDKVAPLVIARKIPACNRTPSLPEHL